MTMMSTITSNFRCGFQKITVYETSTRYFLVGTYAGEHCHYVLKIDRTEIEPLQVTEDPHPYTTAELRELLHMIRDSHPAMKRKLTCYGLIGFVRFLEGYYMLLLTSHSVAAKIGYHTINKVTDISTLYIPCDDNTRSNTEEQRMFKTFQVVDLASNFYFSYSYNLTQTLQHNFLYASTSNSLDSRYVWNQYLMEPMSSLSNPWKLPLIHGCIVYRTFSVLHVDRPLRLVLIARRSAFWSGTRFLRRGADSNGNVANEIETEQILYDCAAPSDLRTGRFTSFVQHRGSIPLQWFQDQARSTVGTKPPIELGLPDPYCARPRRHFKQMSERYNSPIIVVDLVKRGEGRQRGEASLGIELRRSISYLNLFLSPSERILYLAFDMARYHKSGCDALSKLERIGRHVLEQNGVFTSFRPLFIHTLRTNDPDSRGGLLSECEDLDCVPYQLQSGVARTNCVDCLDRTNAAQFAFGKIALGRQLFELGVIERPEIGIDSGPVQLLEEIYQTQGDTMAMQYAGSQLVHSTQTYRQPGKKKASNTVAQNVQIKERSRDVIQTLSRYYSSTFSDAEKQNAINLFLGVERPYLESAVDCVREDELTDVESIAPQSEAGGDECTNDEIESSFELDSKRSQYASECDTAPDHNDRLDLFSVHYNTTEMTSFDVEIEEQQRNIRRIGSYGCLVGRSMPLKMTAAVSASTSSVDKLLRMQHFSADSTESLDSPACSPPKSPLSVLCDDFDSEHQEQDEQVLPALLQQRRDFAAAKRSFSPMEQSPVPEHRASRAMSIFNELFPSMQDVYGTSLKCPSRRDMAIYARYARMAVQPEESNNRRFVRVSDDASADARIQPLTDYTDYCAQIPIVPEESMRIYERYIETGRSGPKDPDEETMALYRAHAALYARPATPP